MVCAFIGTTFGAVGIACLYGSWKGVIPKNPWLVPCSWLLLAVSIGGWILASGAEFGISYSLMIIPLLAWGAALANMDVRQ